MSARKSDFRVRSRNSCAAGEASALPFPALQLALDRLSYQVGALFTLLQNRIHAVESALGKARRSLLVIDLFPAHAKRIDDITNCYKSLFCRYHLLRLQGLLISFIHQQRRAQMTNKPGSIIFVEAFLAASEAGVIDLEQNAIDNPNMADHYRRVARRLAKKNAATRAILAKQGF